MAQAVSKTSLVNKALTLCGAAPITNITDDTNNARIANRVYDISRKSILSECKWNFATTRVTLALSADSLAWTHLREDFVYVRPATIITIFGTSDRDAAWREEGDHIISDTQNLGLKFVYDHDDPAKYPALFADAFIIKLCADISYMIINSKTKAEGFLAAYEKIFLPKAMSVNSQTGTQQPPHDDEWERAKFGTEGDPARSYDG